MCNGQKREREMKWNILLPTEWIGVQRLELGSHTTPVWYHLAPSAFWGYDPQWTGSVCLCTFAYTLTGTLRKPAGKSPLDYHETVAGLNVVTKQHNTLFTSLKCKACIQMANWKQRHLASAIVLRRLWTAKNSENDFLPVDYDFAEIPQGDFWWETNRSSGKLC